ncbi:MAG: hypothetical protein ABSF54_21535 [Bryobacteraceae bacterium]|jgi:hypothetical protein
MEELDELRASIRALHEKIDRVVALLSTLPPRKPPNSRPPRPKPSPLTQEDVTALQAQFAALYERWVNGYELETQEALDKLDVDQLRRLADANNLNVTAKMPKQQVLHILGARFREKKQIHKPTGPREGHGT